MLTADRDVQSAATASHWATGGRRLQTYAIHIRHICAQCLLRRKRNLRFTRNIGSTRRKSERAAGYAGSNTCVRTAEHSTDDGFDEAPITRAVGTARIALGSSARFRKSCCAGRALRNRSRVRELPVLPLATVFRPEARQGHPGGQIHSVDKNMGGRHVRVTPIMQICWLDSKQRCAQTIWSSGMSSRPPAAPPTPATLVHPVLLTSPSKSRVAGAGPNPPKADDSPVSTPATPRVIRWDRPVGLPWSDH
jgi:hypothetical protein